jgi:hypothetical protein
MNQRMIVNDELENMWMEVVMDYFKVQPYNFPGENEENC